MSRFIQRYQEKKGITKRKRSILVDNWYIATRLIFFKIIIIKERIGQHWGPITQRKFLVLYPVYKQLLKIFYRTATSGYDTYLTTYICIKSFRNDSMIKIRIF